MNAKQVIEVIEAEAELEEVIIFHNRRLDQRFAIENAVAMIGKRTPRFDERLRDWEDLNKQFS